MTWICGFIHRFHRGIHYAVCIIQVFVYFFRLFKLFLEIKVFTNNTTTLRVTVIKVV